MKILIICSTSFYDCVKPIKEKLEKMGHHVTLPNSYDNPNQKNEKWNLGQAEYTKWKSEMFELSREKIKIVDAVLVLNLDKNGKKNYIGGATFIEIYEAFINNKKIYLYNDVPQEIFYEEIVSFAPIIINSNVDLVK